MGMATGRTSSPPRDGAVTAGRAGLLGATLAAGCALLSLGCARHSSSLLARAGESAPEDGLVLGLELTAVGAGTVLAGWLALLFLAGTVETLSGSPVARALAPVHALTQRIAPDLGPRFAAGLVGSVVVLTSAGTAQAQEVPAGHPPTQVEAMVSPDVHQPARTGAAPSPDRHQPAGPEAHPSPDPGWRPTASAGYQSPDPTVIELVSRGSAEPDTVVVRTGDTLWDIAARHLGPEADAASIATEWPRWHEVNRESIGADPDLLLPGTVLVPPPPAETVREVAS